VGSLFGDTRKNSMSPPEPVFTLQPDTRVMVAGARGLVGSAVVHKLRERGVETILQPTSADLDLTQRDSVFSYLAENTPDVVVDAAAKVGGIHANATYPAQFLSDNIQIQVNLMDASAEAGVDKFVFLGSSCIYPKFAPQPIPESSLMTGDLEPTNSAYAVAKIAGIEQVKAHRSQYNRSWISAMPTNIYGPGDNFHPENSHVVPALIRRIHEAKRDNLPDVTIWGSGTPLREFLYSEDLADAIIFLIEHYDQSDHINVGSGQEVSIAELARTIVDVVGYEGALVFDPTKPDGTPRKLLDNSRIEQLGWTPTTPLRDGLATTYQWFLDNEDAFRGK
jgi:GDP-L-fucose synthase